MGRKIDRTGEERLNNFGSKIIIEKYRGALDIDVYFPEYNWVFEHARYGDFKNGSIKCPYEPRTFGIGYLGEGKYKAFENGKLTDEYNIWHHMLGRCYNPKYQEKEPSYKGCMVEEYLLNFQHAAEWYNENIYQIGTERMHLDKDILVKDNKIYSPNTCLIVPQSINEIFHVSGRKTKDIDLPYTILRTSKEKYSVSFRGKSLGIYDTVDKALDTYLKAKKNYIRQKVKEMENELPTKVRDALLAW